MSNALVRRALETALATWAAAQVPAIPVAWQNLAFTAPNPPSRYLRSFLIPATTRSQSLDRTHRKYSGIYQVTVCVPSGTGPVAAEALASALDALFTPTVPLTAAGLKLTLTDSAAIAAPVQEPGWHVLAVSIPYRADTTP